LARPASLLATGITDLDAAVRARPASFHRMQQFSSRAGVGVCCGIIAEAFEAEAALLLEPLVTIRGRQIDFDAIVLASLQARTAVIALVGQHLKRLEETGETQLSVTDPDARLMVKSGQGVAGYNVQVAVDD